MASNLGSDTRNPTNFQDEISKMMYGFGDSPNPNPETVLLIESIVLQQLRSLVQEAYQVSVERGKKSISNYELIYLMHKNKNVLKLKRLHDFQIAQDESDDFEDFAEIQEFMTHGEVFETEGTLKRRKRTHIKIIKELDGTSELLKINCDYLGRIRKIRAKNVTDTMPSEQYEPFQEARCTSFRTNKAYSRGLSKLKQWINPDKKFKITSSGLEVLCFIGYETVGDIVDAVLLTRRSKTIGYHCGFSSLQLDNGVSIQWAISVAEVNEALANYFTSNFWLNSLFFKNMGLDYLEGLAM